jgi:hypothetical protein
MNKYLFGIAFGLGGTAVVWVGSGFVGTNLLALTMTALIGAVFVFGAWELRQFRQATSALSRALAATPAPLVDLGHWLTGLPASLRTTVRLRVEGERIGLPGPSLTPYLVGLLVMLGMLGTFLGMVVTLNGAVFALEGTTDLQAIRTALAAPIKGLGLAFGTSVAGVAASAMLGLMSALSRRERVQAAQLLDTQIATNLRDFSLVHQRQETFKALQSQSQALPAVVTHLQAMMTQMERMSTQLNERLLGNQDQFHKDVKGVYTDLAVSVDTSLRNSLSQSAQIAGESLQPAVDAALNGIAAQAQLMHERMANTVQLQLDGLTQRFDATASTVAATWTASLAGQEQTNAQLVGGVERTLGAFVDTFEQRSGALVASVNTAYSRLQADQAIKDTQRLQAWTQSLEGTGATLQREWQGTSDKTLAQQQEICSTLTQAVQRVTEQAQVSATQTLADTTRLITSAEELMHSRMAAEADWIEQHNGRMEQLSAQMRMELGSLREEEAQRGNAAVARLSELQTALTSHLTTLGTALEDPITRLIETASEAPRAAADVITQLRKEVSNSVARDNELLEERSRIMATLNTLLESIKHACVEQRAVIDTLVASSAVALNTAGSEFSDKVEAEAVKLSDIAAHVTSSAVEVSSLSEAFGFAVNSFSEANQKLIANLQRIEGAMDKSMARSDDQLAYYVAQAREIIDLSLMSQKEIFEELRQLSGKQAAVAEEVA